MQRIRILVTSNCSKCKAMEAWLKAQKIEFEQVNIDDDANAKTNMLFRGMTSLPIMAIGEVYYSAEDFKKLYAQEENAQVNAKFKNELDGHRC